MDKSEWLDAELAGCRFGDERLGQRLRELLSRLWTGIGESIPLACQDWAHTKAAYRFLSNAQVDEGKILAGHFQATAQRCATIEAPVLVLHDTTEFDYRRMDPTIIGSTRKGYGGKDENGAHTACTVAGILMHSSLVVSLEGLPLGLAAIKFWNRHTFKGCDSLKKHINPTRVPIEKKESIRWLDNLKQATALLDRPQRCIHIGDRESDIYELFCAAQQAQTHFLFRTCVDRLAGDGGHTISDEMEEVDVKGLHRIEVRDQRGNLSTAVLTLKFRRLHVLPPTYKQKRYPALNLTVLHAQERCPPVGRDAIDWKLITDLPIRSRQDAIEKLQWYAMRWKIETFHKILKSGCKAQQSKLRTAPRLVNLLALYCILSWRLFWMTMIKRCCDKAPPALAFTLTEIAILDLLVKDKRDVASAPKHLASYLTKLARLGGYLARSRDPPPGNTVMWRGLIRLMDIELGFEIARKCG